MGLDFLHTVDQENCKDTYYVDLDMHDTPQSGCAYIIADESPAIIETGMGRRYERILDSLTALGIDYENVEVIAPTHVHLDHAGGAGYLADNCPNATVVTHEKGARHLIDPSKLIAGTKQVVGDLWQYYREPIPIPEERIEPITDGSTINLSTHTLTGYYAPGHADHQMIYHDEKTNWTFVADAAGIYVPQGNHLVPTTPPVGFHFEQSLEDLQMLRDLASSGLLYTHFGPRTDVKEAIDEYESVLGEWVNDIRKKRQELSDDEAVQEYFVSNTNMPDLWNETKTTTEIRMNVRGVLKYLDENHQ